MMFNRFNLSARRLVRGLVAFSICLLLFVSTVSNAFAVTSKPGDGEANLTEIELKSQEAALSDPYSLEKTKDEANQGLNEVQGDADKEKMLNPANTTAPTFEKQIKEVVGKITGK